MELINVEDARQAARRRLPRIFFDYIDGGAFGEATLRANRADFDRWRLVQRVLVNPASRDLATTYLGSRHPLPFMLGPVGFLGLYAGRGEQQATQAAHAAGVPLCLSSFSIASIAELRRETAGPLMFQLYILKDRSFCEELLAEAERAGVDTLFLTVDTAITSVRERDVRNGFRSLTKLSPGLLAQFLARPSWFLDLMRNGAPQVRAVSHKPEFGRGVLAQAAALSSRIDQTLSWQDVAWLRGRWKGRLVIKGILAAADALRARDEGADGIVVSNHGGRQLDCASSTIGVLPEIAAALDGSLEILIDGGFRRGSDIVKALALGASGVLLGRAYAFALAAAGTAGVSRIIEALARETDITLALMGLASVDELRAKGAAVLRPA
ncbi:alpha-hydroxy acid oxidase [Labrys monachus]|uniref:Isopentenyl diphosphate isomerase/L-lactate dehydrogenase-like FMN-dependent dehydrogenase n=1 Tax=Labrys monachus TaxID=217067 RepID=A0ABU0FAS6_9HYPH|nr:alpha-hydroxy acid oxidase [Labrys monachus]MDQ0391140.1 isopentenyl diphosphate isomerase/L-lactate dehydrogenase-like FMN-dependent dehydrogenase [Labrys monachus]